MQVRTLTRATAVVTLGLAVLVAPAALLPATASAAAPACSTTGTVTVTDTDNSTVLGHVSNQWNSFGEYVVTTTPADYLSITLPDGGEAAATASNPQNATYPLLGAVNGFSSTSTDIGSGSVNYAYLGGTTSTTAGAAATAGANSFTNATGVGEAIESPIWTLGSTGSIAPQWINSDLSTPTTYLVDIGSILVITGDPTVFGNTFGAYSDVALSIDPGDTTCPKALPSVALSGSTSFSTVGQSVTLTAVIGGVASGPAPTGTVAFSSNGFSIVGCESSGIFSTGAHAGVAVCETSDLAVGVDALSAMYSGDSNYATANGIGSHTVTQITPTIALAAVPPSGDVYGQSVTLTATESDSGGGPGATGTVDFTSDSGSIGCDSVALDGLEQATCTTTDLAVGSDGLSAVYSGDTDYAGGTGNLTYPVGQAASVVGPITVGPSSITVHVLAVLPGAGTPTGSVDFSVDGSSVGTAPLVSGVATLSYAVPSGASRTVAAVYSGDANFTGSSNSVTRVDPTLTAKVTSAHHKTSAGWYRSPVTVTFTCTANGSKLTTPCPSPVTLRHNVAAGSVTRTIKAHNGGVATVVVSPINIDRTRPTVSVKGVNNGHVYGAAPTLTCVGRDSLSGVARCTIHKHRSGATVKYTAVAVDNAGNVSKTIHGSYFIETYYVVGVPFKDGRFVVHIGHDYSVDAAVEASQPPRYFNAAPETAAPKTGDYPMLKVGKRLWTIRISITAKMKRYPHWNLGVFTGGKLHLIPITVLG